MKNALSIASTLCLGFALTLTACGKDKKEATKADSSKVEPAATEPAKTEPAAAAPKADDKPAADTAAKGGW